MLTPEQEKWIESLSDRIINIEPYDPESEEIFNIVERKIKIALGADTHVEHTGSTLFKIAGQDEVDVAIPIEKRFEEYIKKLEPLFGEVRSLYPDRARFEVKEGNKKIDLKIVDINNPNYVEGKMFDVYLINHPDALEKYRILKEESNGLTAKEYNRRKTEFTNEILRLATLE